MEHLCSICEKYIQSDGLVQVTQWSGGRGKTNQAMFRDPRTGAIHNLHATVTKQKAEPEPEPEPAVVKKENRPEAVAPPPTLDVETATPDTEPPLTQTTVMELVNPTPEAESSWLPLPEEWFDATVKKRGPGYVFLTLSNGEDVFSDAVRVVNAPNGHECALQAGDKTAVRIKQNDKSSPRWLAIEVSLETPRELAESESATVQWWDNDSGKYGMVERSCGCWIFVSLHGTYDDIFLQPGDAVRISNFKPATPPHTGVVAGAIEQEYQDEF